MPRLLDLFCKAGGAGMGYHLAGFEVVGVDIEPQPHYPFEFHQADALTYPLDGFDAVHASPPCQAYSRARVLHHRSHSRLIEPTRAKLTTWGGLWVIENVEGAPLVNPVTLCGTTFGLRVACRDGVKRELRRHRLFESSMPLTNAGGCDHRHPAVSVFGGGERVNRRPECRAAYSGTAAERRAVMGIDWMVRDELSQAIPPAYTRFIGVQLMAHLTGVAA
jgi:DNA (cytosine-5)-methyltransferase 1